MSCDSEDSRPLVRTGLFEESKMINGEERDYFIHIPANYEGTESVPLMFFFHGGGSTIQRWYDLSGLNDIADEEQFILVLPQALEHNGTSHWFGGRSDEEVNLVRVLIANLSSRYNVDATRIYACGVSSGAMFSFELACEMNDKIAAIGGVAGHMTGEQLNFCSSTRPVSVLQIHGTADMVIRYSGVQDVLDFWIANNNISNTPVIMNLQDEYPGDSSTVEHYRYSGGDQGTEVQHFKVINGGHEWPGRVGNMDMDASWELWNFVSQFDINGKI